MAYQAGACPSFHSNGIYLNKIPVSCRKVAAVCSVCTFPLTRIILLILCLCILGITLMAASQTEEIDVLWGISPDPFPFQSPLKEMQVTTFSSS